jgi:ubiquinone/menaquinone biosynthesis C-methylase UbiE
MDSLDTYKDYARAALAEYESRDPSSRYALVNAAAKCDPAFVLDVGCGAGQELLPFLEKTRAYCVGVDVADGLGTVSRSVFGEESRAGFVRSQGERLPFAEETFDVVLCRVALPYMNNARAISEVARVLKPNGVYLLKTHAPPFYFSMIRQRIRSLDPRLLAYPVICLAASIWHMATGRQLEKGFWQGKETFQTSSFLKREFERNGMHIAGYAADNNRLTPSLLVIKAPA